MQTATITKTPFCCCLFLFLFLMLAICTKNLFEKKNAKCSHLVHEYAYCVLTMAQQHTTKTCACVCVCAISNCHSLHVCAFRDVPILWVVLCPLLLCTGRIFLPLFTIKLAYKREGEGGIEEWTGSRHFTHTYIYACLWKGFWTFVQNLQNVRIFYFCFTLTYAHIKVYCHAQLRQFQLKAGHLHAYLS